ncbi:KpsF/GutQ family sugar-phosphate isomerase [Salinisphaera sp. W335]|uniref:Arabinose 5-phosphate isomerase n=1 Tax=Spectribacter hydrogenoxidans TaxID=3075608 RepID=A0ABU3BX26_9GAMM|nr:KpsF/GutQ family sugar-phosphate isomerase [Salinisphaera sp. W335]MDT0633848.1 KpsF/GutQ family sugar-phosphate isomerase [Salinisphaera sp. W335]
MMDSDQLIAMGRRVIDIEADAVTALRERIDERFAAACRLFYDCRGRVIVTGMGKSGHVGGKIAATLASTGTPAFFVHPGEASHGDLGMVTGTDVVLALSNSGETAEILTILPLIKRLGVPLVAMTGKPGSTLAVRADVHIDVAVALEACPLDLAPTSSTTAALTMGDALAIALLEAREFTAEDFARSHPGGSLGKRLLVRLADVMHQGDDVPAVTDTTTLREALLEMTRKRLGMTAVTDAEGRLTGLFTDGDLRRALDADVDVRTTPIHAVMTPDPRTAPAEMLAAEALRMMEIEQINGLLVVDDEQRPIGALNMRDLLLARVL